MLQLERCMKHETKGENKGTRGQTFGYLNQHVQLRKLDQCLIVRHTEFFHKLFAKYLALLSSSSVDGIILVQSIVEGPIAKL